MPIVKANSTGTSGGGTQKSLFSFFTKKPAVENTPSKDEASNNNTSNSAIKESPASELKKPNNLEKIEKALTNPLPTLQHQTPVVKKTMEVTPSSSNTKVNEKLSLSSAQKKTKLPISKPDDEEEETEKEMKNNKKKMMNDEEDDLVDSPVINRKRKLTPKKTDSSAKKKAKKSALASDDEDEWSANNDKDDDEDYSEDDDEEDGGDDVMEEEEDDNDSFIVDDDDDDEEDDYRRKKSKNKTLSTSRPPIKKQSITPTSSNKPPKGNSSRSTATKKKLNDEPKYSMIFDSTPVKSNSMNIVTPNMKSASRGGEGDEEEDYDGLTTQSTPFTPEASNKSIFQLPEGVVGQGSHEHNFYDFLKPENRRDINGNKIDSPEYNPRTLKVPIKYMNEQTPAMQQWWLFKSQNMDTVLFFKVGKFYEFFHMDADIAFSELDLIYMKGNKAHSGFPEVSYGKFASILVSKGYRVARIEQTETPDMLKERNDLLAKKGLKKDKVVLRELCAVMTKGTRTYCHLDDLSLLEEVGQDTLSTSLLVAIKESLLDEYQQSDIVADHDTAVTEYGITCVDPVLGKVTIAQFQDNKQRTRLRAFLIKYIPTEVLLEFQHFSDETHGVLKLLAPKASIEFLRVGEMPANGTETLFSLYKAQYFTAISNKDTTSTPSKKVQLSTDNLEEVINQAQSWPEILVAAIRGLIDGSSNLMMCAFGAALWQLKRSLIDYEVLSLGKIHAYIPTDECAEIVEPLPLSDDQPEPMEICEENAAAAPVLNDTKLLELMKKKEESENFTSITTAKRMVLDEVALTNLEVLVNNYDRTENGSLWNFINKSKTMGGRRLLRSWLCHPLYHVDDIQKRAEAVEELMSLTQQLESCKGKLKSIPDLERLLTRVHSNGIKRVKGAGSDHPDSRAVMFESSIYTTRKIKDFVDILNGYETVCSIVEVFRGVNFQSSLLTRALRPTASSTPSNLYNGFPLQELRQTLEYFRTIFDEKQAKKDGNIKPKKGINSEYDEAMNNINEITNDLENYLREMKKTTGISDIKYYGNGKDRYQLEVPINLTNKLPNSWYSKSQKKTHRRYWTKYIEDKLHSLMEQEEIANSAQKDTLRSIFEKFDQQRSFFERAIASISLLDALLSLVTISSLPGYVWPNILRKEDTVGKVPVLDIQNGRHPMLEFTLQQKNGTQYIPNDVHLGGTHQQEDEDNAEFNPRLLLLTGPNMGGKSTLLRQTCLIVLLAQIGCRVPADSCVMTPVDRIFTRVGASDRILAGQSTFFVELSETSLILKAATDDSLCILDELGRGTATFDGTAIAHAVVDYLVSKIRCRSLFATHYHLLIEDWEIDPRIKLGHMDCLVHSVEEFSESKDNNNDLPTEQVTFLYKLCDGSSPKSYGINVAKLAGIPDSVIQMALKQSLEFEEKSKTLLEMNGLISKISSVFERLVSISEHTENLGKEELIYLVSEIWKRYNVMKNFIHEE